MVNKVEPKIAAYLPSTDQLLCHCLITLKLILLLSHCLYSISSNCSFITTILYVCVVCAAYFLLSVDTRVSTTPGNLLEFKNPPRNLGNLLEFVWSSWKFCIKCRWSTALVSNHDKTGYVIASLRNCWPILCLPRFCVVHIMFLLYN